MNTQILKYNDQEVEFEFNKKNVMVNATEMAKIFNEDVNHFTRLDSTKKFIEACLKTPEVGFLSGEKNLHLQVFLSLFQNNTLYLHCSKFLFPEGV